MCFIYLYICLLVCLLATVHVLHFYVRSLIFLDTYYLFFLDNDIPTIYLYIFLEYLLAKYRYMYYNFR